MELILDQLELGTEHSLVLTEKLFEYNNYRDIQEFQKQIQLKLLTKNNQLKDIFSTKYQELLDCSTLVNGITKYTSQIVQISNNCSHFLSELQIQNVNQLKDSNQKVKVPVQQIPVMRSKLFQISNQISKLQYMGFIYVPTVLAQEFIQIIEAINPQEAQMKALLDEHLFLFNQIIQTIEKQVEKGSNFIQISKLLLSHEESKETKMGIVLDMLYLHLNLSKENSINKIFECLDKSQQQLPFQQFKLALLICNLLGQIQDHHLKLYFKSHDKDFIDFFLGLEDFSNFLQFTIEHQNLQRQQGYSFILPIIKTQISNLTPKFITNVIKSLFVSDIFDQYFINIQQSSLFQQVLQDQNITDIILEAGKDIDIQQLFVIEFLQYEESAIHKIFENIQIQSPHLENYIKDTQNSYETQQNILQCESVWLKEIGSALDGLNSLLKYPNLYPQIYNLDNCKILIQKYFTKFQNNLNQIQTSLYNNTYGNYDDQLKAFAKISLALNVLNNIWNNKAKDCGMHFNGYQSDTEILKIKISQVQQEQNQSQKLSEDTFINLLEEILILMDCSEPQKKQTCLNFAMAYIQSLRNEYKDSKIDDLLLDQNYILTQNYIKYSNIICLVNPKGHFKHFFDTLNTKQSTNQAIKQLIRPTCQIKQSEDGINFLLFPSQSIIIQPSQSAQTPKRQDNIRVDQQGLQMWAQNKPAQGTNTLQQASPTKPITQATDQTTKMNRFGMAFQSAKERTTSLLYKQYQ